MLNKIIIVAVFLFLAPLAYSEESEPERMEVKQLIADLKQSLQVDNLGVKKESKLSLKKVTLKLNAIVQLEPNQAKYTLYATRLDDKIKAYGLQTIVSVLTFPDLGTSREKPEVSDPFSDAINQIIDQTKSLASENTGLQPKKLTLTIRFGIEQSVLGEFKLLPLEANETMKKLRPEAVQIMILEFY